MLYVFLLILIFRDISRLHVDYKVVVNGLVDLAVVANDKLGNNEKWSLNNLLLNQVAL